ncbi:MAG: 3-dehydroquinate synthase [Cyanobacteria bacterium]|nr:3-dehydroquinate synthase [Cyanobacteriota bacterium]
MILKTEIEKSAQTVPIHIRPGELLLLSEVCLTHYPPKTKLLIVTDAIVKELWGQALSESLKQAGYLVYTYTIPVGESAKCLSVMESVLRFALEAGLSRQDAMIAFGGGVVGDLTGFCAATYFRGIDYIQVPTTLLAQVDSAIGGKVGVNLHHAKNGLGAFYQPRFIWMDPTLVKHLPCRQLRAGLAEVIKYSLIETSIQEACGSPESLSHTPPLFTVLQKIVVKEEAVEKDCLDTELCELISRCVALKTAVVSLDEQEKTGLRALLNLGHTFAHAYEELSGYQDLLHGEAVSLGLVKAAQLASILGHFSSSHVETIIAMLEKFQLPTVPSPSLEPLKLIALMRQDKKATGNGIRFVLPDSDIGRVRIVDGVDEHQILNILS